MMSGFALVWLVQNPPEFLQGLVFIGTIAVITGILLVTVRMTSPGKK